MINRSILRTLFSLSLSAIVITDAFICLYFMKWTSNELFILNFPYTILTKLSSKLLFSIVFLVFHFDGNAYKSTCVYEFKLQKLSAVIMMKTNVNSESHTTHHNECHCDANNLIVVSMPHSTTTSICIVIAVIEILIQ